MTTNKKQKKTDPFQLLKDTFKTQASFADFISQRVHESVCMDIINPDSDLKKKDEIIWAILFFQNTILDKWEAGKHEKVYDDLLDFLDAVGTSHHVCRMVGTMFLDSERYGIRDLIDIKDDIKKALALFTFVEAIEEREKERDAQRKKE